MPTQAPIFELPKKKHQRPKLPPQQPKEEPLPWGEDEEPEPPQPPFLPAA